MLIATLMAVAFGIRLFAATTVPMPWEEACLVEVAGQISLAPGAVDLPIHGSGQHPAGQLYLARLGALVLGGNILGFRLMSVVLGTASCWILFALVRRVWGTWPAAFALWLLCFNGFHIGVSRSAIERTYLFFSLFAIYLFWRAVGEGRPWYMVAAGVVIGLGGLVAEHTFLLLPLFAVYLLLGRDTRPWLRRWPPWVALLAAIAVFMPYAVVNLSGPAGQSALEQDFRYDVNRLGQPGLSYGPLALYVSPLYYTLSERISRYSVMDVVSGALLLGGVLHAVFGRKDGFAKYLLVVFFGFFGLFSIFTTAEPEFKWAATSLFAAAALSGRLLHGLWQRRPLHGVVMGFALVYIAGCGIWVANASHNCYYDPLVSPSVSAIREHQSAEVWYVGRRPDYDFSAVAAGPLFPLRYTRYYLVSHIVAARLVSRGEVAPELFPLLVRRAAAIDPGDPEVQRLMEFVRAGAVPGEAGQGQAAAPEGRGTAPDDE
jgi:4-amino-4-deoxy-L-arabinose transferase-like glycosyltransferase